MQPNYLVINSKDGQFGNSSSFDVQFTQSLINVKSLRLLSASIPNSTYNINSTNNIIYVNGNPVIIPIGSYNTSNLPSTLQTTLNAAGLGIVFTVTYSDISFKLTISGTLAFTIGSGVNSINDILGLSVSGPSIVVTGNNIVDLRGDQYYYLIIDVLNNNVKGSNLRDYGAYIIPTNVPSGGISQFRSNTDYPIVGTTTSNINKMNIVIKSYNGQYVNFNGANIVLIFEINYT
jgi:hypothetical protein